MSLLLLRIIMIRAQTLPISRIHIFFPQKLIFTWFFHHMLHKSALRNIMLLLDAAVCLFLHAEFERLGLIPGFKKHRVSLFLAIHFCSYFPK